MAKEIVKSITDKDWANENELGTIEETIEYSSGDKMMKVKVVAHVLSGAEVDAIESQYAVMNMETGEFSVDSQGYNDAKMCAVFKMEPSTLQNILRNKSADLRLKMMELMNRATGANKTKKEIDAEKNSASPEA